MSIKTIIPSRRSGAPPAPDDDALRAVVARRTALRFGLSIPVAAVVAALAGLGPRAEEGRR